MVVEFQCIDTIDATIIVGTIAQLQVINASTISLEFHKIGWPA
jgi:hypothetical protein